MTVSTVNVGRVGAVLNDWVGSPRRRLLVSVYTLAAIWLLPQGSPNGESLIIVAQTLLLGAIAVDGAQVTYRKFGVLVAVVAVAVAIVTWLLVTGVWLL